MELQLIYREISKALPPNFPNKEIVVRFKLFAILIASNTLGLWPEEDIENKISPFFLKLEFVLKKCIYKKNHLQYLSKLNYLLSKL